MDTLPLVAPNRSAFPATRPDRVRKWMHPLVGQRPPRRHGDGGDALRRTGLRRDGGQGRRRAQPADAARHHLPHLLDDQPLTLDGDHDAL